MFATFDPGTKLVPAYRIGERFRPHGVAFTDDLSLRLANRVQLSEAEPSVPTAIPRVVDQQKTVIPD